MVERWPSKPDMRVRFPSPAPYFTFGLRYIHVFVLGLFTEASF